MHTIALIIGLFVLSACDDERQQGNAQSPATVPPIISNSAEKNTATPADGNEEKDADATGDGNSDATTDRNSNTVTDNGTGDRTDTDTDGGTDTSTGTSNGSSTDTTPGEPTSNTNPESNSYVTRNHDAFASERLLLGGIQSGHVTPNPTQQHFIQVGISPKLVAIDAQGQPGYLANATVDTNQLTPWHGGIIGCQGVTVTGAAEIDSYDSEDSTAIASGHAQVMTLLADANIAISDGTINGNVLAIGPRSHIIADGLATIGVANAHIEATGTIHATSIADIIGEQIEAIAPVLSQTNCDPIDVSAVFASLGDAATDLSTMDADNDAPVLSPGRYAALTTSDQDITLKPGRYDFASISLSGISSLTLADPGLYIIKVNGDVLIDESSTVTIRETANLSLFLSGSFTVSAVATFSNPSAAHTVFIMSTASTADAAMTINGASSFSGVLYAPTAAIILDGTSDFYGAMRGRTVTVKSVATIYFDRFLERVIIE